MDEEFKCVRCGNCCRWSGCVKVTASEIDAVAVFFGVSPQEFIGRHTRLMPDRQGLSLLERTDGACEFLIDGPPAACAIEPVKPAQCKDFPYRWNFPGWRDECMAGHGRKKNAG
ncbi:MAG: YkgJ family cysteine cluster protein [Victivallaceae bacterium]|nr:YkgJ family cysteine cluster protein [Victivallaceae bacterium]